jgi:hypothetical protein
VVGVAVGRGGGEAVALPGGAQRPIRDAEFLVGLVDADLGGPLPGLLGGVAVLVEAGASGPALEPLGLGQAVVVQGVPQGLLGDAQLAGGPVDAVLVGQGQRRLGRGGVVQEPGALGVRGAAAEAGTVSGGGAGEDPCVVIAGLGAVHRGLQAGAADRAAGADLLGRGGLGGLAGFGEEQLRVDLGAGGVQAPVPLPVGPIDIWGWAGELLVGGGQPLGQWRLSVAGAQLPGEVAHVAVGDAQPPGELAGAARPGRRVLLLGVPELGDALGGGRRPGAQLGELLADAVLVAAELPGELAWLQPLACAELAGPVAAFHLDGQPFGVGGASGERRLLVAAGGEMGLQIGELRWGWVAVADGLAEGLQAVGAVVLGAQAGQPLAGHCR